MTDYEKIIKAVRAIAKNELPDIDISEILREHKCLYFLAVLKKSDHEIMFNKFVITERYKACATVFEEMRNIPYAVIKGAVLSKAAYGDIVYRKSGDIDLLVSRDNADKITAVMRNNGFIQGRITEEGIVPFTRQEILFHSALTHQTAPFVKKTENMLCPYVQVDINMDILWGEQKEKFDMGYILSKTLQTNICGVTVYKLSPVMEFISLCLHHYKDMNSIYLLSKGSLKLYLFCDIYYYLHNNNVDISELTEECDKLNITEYIYYCVYYADMIFGGGKLDGYLSVLKNGKAESILDTFGLSGNERKKWPISFFERLFSDRFFEIFNNLLDEEDIKKIRKNISFM